MVALLVGAFRTQRLARSQVVCRPADTTSAALIKELARYSSATTGDNRAVRDSLRLPYTPANQVVLVTSEAVCKKARDAYQADVAGQGGGLSGRVYVVAIGNPYAVADPSYRVDPTFPRDIWHVLVLDWRYRRLSSYSY